MFALRSSNPSDFKPEARPETATLVFIMRLCIMRCIMHTEHQARILRAAHLCRTRKLSQEQIAVEVGASQSQVSRILSGRGKRFSRLSAEICSCIERLNSTVAVQVAAEENQDLMSAIRETWDGSSTHAIALATVIRSLAAFHRPVKEIEPAAMTPSNEKHQRS